MSELLFSETQKFSPSRAKLFLMVVIAVGIMVLLVCLAATHHLSWIVVAILIPLELLIIGMSGRMKLMTAYYTDRVTFSFPPIASKEQTIKKEDMTAIGLVTYSAMADFGGWGLRFSKQYGTGYIVSGDKGVYIKQKSGRSIFLSTQEPEKAAEAIRRYQTMAS